MPALPVGRTKQHFERSELPACFRSIHGPSGCTWNRAESRLASAAHKASLDVLRAAKMDLTTIVTYLLP